MISVYKANINDITPEEYKVEFLALPKAEQQRIKALKKDVDKKLSLAAKILLRKAVKENFSVDNFTFSRNINQKPIADFCYLSLSHSGNMAVCAVSDRPVGIDIEAIRAVKEKNQYYFFSSDESLYVNNPDGDRAIRFLEVWTRKEAYFKCADNVSENLSCVSVLTDFNGFLFETEILDGYIISVCKRI